MKIIQLNLNSSTIADAQEVVSYLKNGTVLFAAAGCQEDVKDPTKGNVVPIGSATDGTNVWSLELAYYVHNYHVGIGDGFLTEIRDKNYQCDGVNEERLKQINQEIFKQNLQNTVTPEVPGGKPEVDPFK